ncbi:uncharacterized protein H6S33_007183 [Morchella sextelata]|uniref:uncharacterized protein n=1 Tax=Morchella sextelata TaxID=1174677 RepID=UPI001D05BF85|nr:uncharacterized protein H6S33_007183 [Morchella sextelata]KAH0604152.1 hypothetical protein H6S33_007183 [Morchella sextelata]
MFRHIILPLLASLLHPLPLLPIPRQRQGSDRTVADEVCGSEPSAETFLAGQGRPGKAVINAKNAEISTRGPGVGFGGSSGDVAGPRPAKEIGMLELGAVWRHGGAVVVDGANGEEVHALIFAKRAFLRHKVFLPQTWLLGIPVPTPMLPG